MSYTHDEGLEKELEMVEFVDIKFWLRFGYLFWHLLLVQGKDDPGAVNIRKETREQLKILMVEHGDEKLLEKLVFPDDWAATGVGRSD